MEEYLYFIPASHALRLTDASTNNVAEYSHIVVCEVLNTAIPIMDSFLCGYRTIDMLEWNSLIDDREKIPDLLVVPNVEVSVIKLYKNFNKYPLPKTKDDTIRGTNSCHAV